MSDRSRIESTIAPHPALTSSVSESAEISRVLGDYLLAWHSARYRKFKRPFRRVCRVGGGRASGGLGKDRACASALRHHLGAQSGRPWPFLTESRPFDRLRTGVGPNAPLRDRRRI
jgi:hypothetical protein